MLLCRKRKRPIPILGGLGQDFWKIWSRDYIVELQSRKKWFQTTHHLKEGGMMLLKEDNTPSLTGAWGTYIQLSWDLMKLAELQWEVEEFARNQGRITF